MNPTNNDKLELNAFTLKIIAIIAMTCNHIAHAFGGALPMYLRAPLYIAGGLTFPIMAYLIVEGYHKTSNVKKYMLRLFIFGLLALFPFFWVLNPRLNVMFTLLAGLLTLYLRDNIKSKPLFWLCFIVITLLTNYCDWNFVGVIMIFMYGTVKGPKRKIILPVAAVSVFGFFFIAFSVLFNGWNAYDFLDAGYFCACLCAIPLLLSYNGKRGFSPPALRYLFYIYYPAHLLVIAGVKWLF
jgi:hypothetical protein